MNKQPDTSTNLGGPARTQRAPAPSVPAIRELVAAMTGAVPTSGPARPILQAAFLLATLGDWIIPDTVSTDTGATGTGVLWDIGIADTAELVRAQLIDRINHTATDPTLGPAVDLVARAWQQYRHTTGYTTTPAEVDLHRQATAALITARAAYTRLRRHLHTHAHHPATRTARTTEIPGLRR